MKQNHYIEILRGVGLTEHESSVYFSMVSLGPSTILKIARTSEVKRTTIYSVIDSLKEKGLVHTKMIGLKSLFVAESPEKLESILEGRKNQFKKSLGDFLSIYNKGGGETLIKIYEGLESTKSVYEGLIKDIKPGEDYLIISNPKKWLELDRKYFVDFTERRAKLPIKIRMLLQDSDDAQYLKKYQQNFNFQAKILPPETDLITNLIVTPQKVVTHQLNDPVMAVVVENKSMIKMHQEMFEVMWNSIPDQD
jgi:sugar-specific transcriptional regulator TrmB